VFCSRKIILKRAIIAQLIMIFPGFLLARSLEPSTGPYPEKENEFSSHLHNQRLKSVLLWFSHLRLCLPSNLFSSGLPVVNLCTLTFSLRPTCPNAVILLYLNTLIISSEQDRVQSFLTTALTSRDSSFIIPRIYTYLHLGSTGPNSSYTKVSFLAFTVSSVGFSHQVG
jgi:hypothetical protein